MNCAKHIDSRLCLRFEQFSAVTGLILRALLYPSRLNDGSRGSGAVMNWLRRVFGKRQLEKQLDSELRFHFERVVASNLANGMSEEAAHRSARMQFGGTLGIGANTAMFTVANDMILRRLPYPGPGRLARLPQGQSL